MNNITLVYPYYNNPETLAHHAQHWATLPRWMNDALRIRVIDDGSSAPAAEVLAPTSATTELYRIKVDKPWNQHGARNLAAHVATSDEDWLLMVDMDILVPEPVVSYLLQAKLDSRVHYTFRRDRADGRPWKPAFNVFLATKRSFWNAGGYDEDFCGSYGGDGFFVRALRRVAPAVPLNQSLIALNDFVSDCSTSILGRHASEFRDEYARRVEAKRAAGPDAFMPRNPLRFEWERVW